MLKKFSRIEKIALLGAGSVLILTICGFSCLAIALLTTPVQKSIPEDEKAIIIPTLTPTEEAHGALPGLQAANIKVSLEQRGFDCTQAEKFTTANIYNWTCQQETGSYLLQADIYGETLRTVDYVSAIALDYSGTNGKLQAEFLGFIATVPYDGAEPDRARIWVERNIQNDQSHEMTFGGIRYSLYGRIAARTLEIGIFKW